MLGGRRALPLRHARRAGFRAYTRNQHAHERTCRRRQYRDSEASERLRDAMTAPRSPSDPGAPASSKARSPWSPLHNALFRSLWIATMVSNIGSWMQDVGAGWLMTSLSPSPSMVALVEAADSFPVMLLALPAGALADIVDRRRLLIAIQVYLVVAAGALGV